MRGSRRWGGIRALAARNAVFALGRRQCIKRLARLVSQIERQLS